MKREELEQLAHETCAAIARSGMTLSVAESCTGGLLSASITEVAGCSAYYKGGICSYCNEIKHRLLGVRQETLDLYTAVSDQTAREMALGVAERFDTDLGAGITGYAGPDGGEDGTPAGTIYVAVCRRGEVRSARLDLEPVRAQARILAAAAVLKMLKELTRIHENG
ncbi:MAG: CinA family protein [Butyricicoccaceae bacterium]